ncbi:MAG: DUF3656 domain-containing protein, partial [Alphaproteobacteria bacterium]|nr:DUF3656 domain-containing protein [Alphaproteobacteria bacterium]
DSTSQIQNNINFKRLDKGYLLSPRDLCSLEYLPKLIEAGVCSFKIEGSMKNPEYVATVTRIYRKYIDLALDKSMTYKIDKNDLEDLMQVFNRGGFSSGHLNSKENRNLVFKEKPNNMGIYLGKILKYNKKKGLVTCKLENSISIGDSISFEKENTKYTISELMEKNKETKSRITNFYDNCTLLESNSQEFRNIRDAFPNQEVTFGRMKGNINLNDKIYKIANKKLSKLAYESYSKENIKNSLICNLKIKKNTPIYAEITCPKFNININYTFDYIPQSSQNLSLTKAKIIEQFCKTQDTCFNFSKFNIELDDNLFIPISVLNNVRRLGIELIQKGIIDSFKRKSNLSKYKNTHIEGEFTTTSPKISLLLNILNLNFDYTLL